MDTKKPPKRVIYNRTISSEDIKRELKTWARASILSPNWRVGLGCVAAGFLTSAIFLWVIADNELLIAIQTFNGALTIPVGALTWAFAFTFVFLVPMKAMQILMAKTMLYSIEAQEELVEKVTREILDPIRDGKHPAIDRFEKMFRNEMKLLREEIKGEREEMDKAIEQGEQAAAAEAEAGTWKCETCGEDIETSDFATHQEVHALDGPPPGKPQ